MSASVNVTDAMVHAFEDAYCKNWEAQRNAPEGAQELGTFFATRAGLSAALAAQPSPGGQGEEPTSVSRAYFNSWAQAQGFALDGDDKKYYSQGTQGRWEAWQAALVSYAARQPVGEPVAVEIPQGAIINGAAFADRLEQDYQFECPAGPLVNCTDYVEFRRCFDFLAQWASSLPPLYAAPPAQAVDLGQLLPAVRMLVVSARTSGGTAGRDAHLCEALDRVEALLPKIDSQAVGNG